MNETLRTNFCEAWTTLKQNLMTTIQELKAKSIDNYPRRKKITLLELASIPLRLDDDKNATGRLYDLSIQSGSITKTPTRFYSQTGVELFVEVLEVVVIQDLSDDNNIELTNYVRSELKPYNGSTIEEV